MLFFDQKQNVRIPTRPQPLEHLQSKFLRHNISTKNNLKNQKIRERNKNIYEKLHLKQYMYHKNRCHVLMVNFILRIKT